MNKSTFTLNAFCISALLLSTTSVQSMELNLGLPTFKQLSHLISMIWTSNHHEQQRFLSRKYEQLALAATEYNQHNPLFLLLNDLLCHIFSYCSTHEENEIQSLEKSIKALMRLSTTCKNFTTFKTIGNACRYYAQDVKNHALSNLGHNMNHITYARKRIPALALICAGANTESQVWKGYLLTQAVKYNDIPIATELFKHHANPNVLEDFRPLFFDLTSVPMAKLFIDSGVDLNATSTHSSVNILWLMIRFHFYSAELLELYLQHGANPKNLNPLDNSCLLHNLGNTDCIQDVDNFLKKAQLLLDAIPDMIDALDKNKQTPLDIAQASLDDSRLHGTPATVSALEQLIALFKECDNKRTQELKHEVAVLEQID